MNKKKNLLLLNKITYFLEILVSFLIIIGIVISLPDIIKYFYQILSSSADVSYEVFKHFLSHILILVIGLEFILMMIAHSDNSIIYLVNFVVARKMLIYSDTTKDLILGVIALLILFVIKKFLITNTVEKELSSGIFSANTPIPTINSRFNYKIDDMGFNSVGGLVYCLLKQQGSEVEEGALIEDQNYIYQVERASHGVIDSVIIQKK